MRLQLISAVLGGVVVMAQPALVGAQQPDLHDGVYAGSMVQEATPQSPEQSPPACVYLRAVSMKVERGNVTVWYADWGGNTIHYRGKVDAAGNVQAWHTNGDGSKSILTGQFSGGAFIGQMERDRQLCPYKLTLAPAPAR